MENWDLEVNFIFNMILRFTSGINFFIFNIIFDKIFMENNLRYSQDSEKKWQEFWESNKTNKFNPETSKPIYSIDTPPPTVSGKIHIWHIFSYTQAEVIARYKKMNWNELFYPFGFDDNWLPTEKLVEKEIWKKWSEMDREEFNAECLKVTKAYREKFKMLWQSLGFSVDWDLSYSTISPEVQKVSQTSFLNLIKKWAIYHKESPALWCPECQTAIAQAEVEKKELDSVFYDVAFSLENGEILTISTTRPELMPACVAIFVNPEDQRYSDIVWKNAITPFWANVRILSDDKVDIEKWSGAVMCCTYWDETDMYWVKKYSLDEKIILDKTGKIINTWDEELDWAYHKKARKIIVERLREQGKILAAKDIKHDVWTHERCWTPIEILTVKQWFIKIIDIKDKLIQMWEEISWHPSHMKKRYLEWVENLKWDWCISRQRQFWISIPVWYSSKTWEIILPEAEQFPLNTLSTFPKNLPEWHTREDIYPERDVLDTWATSSLTPLINAEFFEDSNLKNKILPMSLRPQAHDIIRTWALYTIIMGYYHTWTIPFKDIMISGHVLAWKWEKISKSKDNAWSSPEELIAKHWADSVRYWACWWTLGKDMAFDEKEIMKWKKLVTKLWNAARYAELNLGDFDAKAEFSLNDLQPIDKWIIDKSLLVGKEMKKHLDKFNIGNAIISFEQYFWADFCDNYLEIVKDKVANFWSYENWEILKKSSQYWMYNALLNILKLISPVMPHISEELYQWYFRQYEQELSIHNLAFPYAENKDDALDAEAEKLFEIIELTRKFKTDNSIKYWQESEKIIVGWSEEDLVILKKYSNDIRSISRSASVEFAISEESNVQIML